MCPRGNAIPPAPTAASFGCVVSNPAHVMRRIARPALPADVLVEPAVAVRHDVQPRHFLLAQIHRQRIDILLAEPRRHHRVQKRPRPQILRIPTRARQRARDRRREHDPGSGLQHVSDHPQLKSGKWKSVNVKWTTRGTVARRMSPRTSPATCPRFNLSYST